MKHGFGDPPRDPMLETHAVHGSLDRLEVAVDRATRYIRRVRRMTWALCWLVVLYAAHTLHAALS